MLAEGKCPEFSIPDFLEFEINHTYAHKKKKKMDKCTHKETNHHEWKPEKNIF